MVFVEIESSDIINLSHVVRVHKRVCDGASFASIVMLDGKTLHTDLPFSSISRLLQAQPVINEDQQ